MSADPTSVETRFDLDELAKALADDDEPGRWASLPGTERDRYRDHAAVAWRYFEAELDGLRDQIADLNDEIAELEDAIEIAEDG